MASGVLNLSASDSSFEEHRGRYCTICYQRFCSDGSSVPRILTCGHSFCTGCLDRLIGNVLRGHIRCPTCKRDTMVPGLANEVTKLAKNFGVLDLLEGIDEEKALASTVSVTNPTPLCNEHENEPKKVYCLTDSELICIYCQVYGVHSGHDCKLISILAQEYRKVLNTLCESYLSKKESLVAAKKLVNDTGTAVCIKEKTIMREITHHFVMLRSRLYRRESQLKALLKNRTSAKVMLLDKQKRQMTDLLAKCDEQYDIYQQVISGSDQEIVQQKDKLQNDIEALVTQIQKHNTSPCTRDDLICQLEPDIVDKMTNHGVLIKDSRKVLPGVSLPELDYEAGSSTPSGEVSPSPRSDSTGDSEDHDIEWQELEARPSPRNNNHKSPRRRLDAADIILFDDDDMDLETVHVCGVAEMSGEEGDRQCEGCGTPHPEQTRANRSTKRILHPTSSSPGRQPIRRKKYGEMTTSEESPDLSDLTDMELEVNIRSAWSNRSGWSVYDDTSLGPVNSTAPTSTNAVSARQVIQAMQNTNRRLNEDNFGASASSSRTSGGGAQSRRGNNPDPWEIATSPRRNHASSGHHIHPRTGQQLKCSVFNCSTGAASFYVKCKNCTRLFCQRCTSSSISARRCYKRPRGHSFVFIPCHGGNASANNNQIRHPQHGHRHARIHPGGSGDASQHTSFLTVAEQSWRCTNANCETLNKYSKHSRTCIRCGRQSPTCLNSPTQTVNIGCPSAHGQQPTVVTEITPEATALSEDYGSATGESATAFGEDYEPTTAAEGMGQEENEPPCTAEEESQHDQVREPVDSIRPGSSGIANSAIRRNDGGYENVCPICVTVNVEDAMQCSSCATQLFL